MNLFMVTAKRGLLLPRSRRLTYDLYAASVCKNQRLPVSIYKYEGERTSDVYLMSGYCLY